MMVKGPVPWGVPAVPGFFVSAIWLGQIWGKPYATL